MQIWHASIRGVSHPCESTSVCRVVAAPPFPMPSTGDWFAVGAFPQPKQNIKLHNQWAVFDSV